MMSEDVIILLILGSVFVVVVTVCTVADCINNWTNKR